MDEPHQGRPNYQPSPGRVPVRFRGHCRAAAGCCTVPGRFPVGGARAVGDDSRYQEHTWAVRRRRQAQLSACLQDCKRCIAADRQAIANRHHDRPSKGLEAATWRLDCTAQSPRIPESQSPSIPESLQALGPSRAKAISPRSPGSLNLQVSAVCHGGPLALALFSSSHRIASRSAKPIKEPLLKEQTLPAGLYWGGPSPQPLGSARRGPSLPKWRPGCSTPGRRVFLVFGGATQRCPHRWLFSPRREATKQVATGQRLREHEHVPGPVTMAAAHC
ncbi:hypothetical protein TRIATDRAFT_130066 [Trichoderma atroviride IMI 206040]|uniref:Uncharacterized protein n=1 Tax=Hypocrea atroviridis (strain ATCC 20476 / IMI 206040) TaxID=452589 RepID=G9P4W7_HYPAI|nr:uncharacterized protein TRIATDRAFT_130066 [Trichoderma atroviride IMI 206040]EHK42049.1 hypothetical protein TRIATDRAFT_130066 [Trichoderma atroviride IMI 206040]